MITVDELQALVTLRYESLDLPTWPNPQAGVDTPPDEQYSRVTEPERYRIVHARAKVWTEVLVEALGVGVETLSNGAVRVVPPSAGTLPLVLLAREVPVTTGEGALAVLEIGVVRADVVLDMQPDCGCDACDSGSQDLLEAVDQTIRHVVGGPFVALRGPGWDADWYPDGGSAGGDAGRPDYDVTMDRCRRLAAGEAVDLPDGTEAFVGRSWLG